MIVVIYWSSLFLVLLFELGSHWTFLKYSTSIVSSTSCPTQKSMIDRLTTSVFLRAWSKWMALSMSGLWEIFTDLLCSPLWREHNQRQTQLQTDWWINHVLSHLVYPLFVVVFAPLVMISGAQRTDKSSREGLTLVPTLRYIRSLPHQIPCTREHKEAEWDLSRGRYNFLVLVWTIQHTHSLTKLLSSVLCGEWC